MWLYATFANHLSSRLRSLKLRSRFIGCKSNPVGRAGEMAGIEIAHAAIFSDLIQIFKPGRPDMC
jgi:hypothetical protein